MDIIDIMMAKALSPQGLSSTNAAQAQEAARQALAAAEAASVILDEIRNGGGTGDGASIEDIHDEIDKLAISVSSVDHTDAIINNLVVEYPDDSTKTVPAIGKLYKESGDNEDGTMTQKAIKSYVNSVASSGGAILDPENAGSVVVVGNDGSIQAGDATEQNIIEALIKMGTYTAKDALGLEMDYENKTMSRTLDALELSAGADFNQYPMFGGRMRCNVADDGTINAFYDDNNYIEDGSNGQVMVYQPKFYYQRLPLKTIDNTIGKSIAKDSLLISAQKQGGFKLHPLFETEDGEELDYVLLPAYEGSLFDTSENTYIMNDEGNVNALEDKLCSIAGVKPISGANKVFNVVAAEHIANNRGEGWHITNMAAESANQMLEIIEFGSMNLQNTLEAGVGNLSVSTMYNCAAITGSTSVLGNNSGIAGSTTTVINGQSSTSDEPGKRAITYRGMENPWGNIWRMIGGLNIKGDGNQEGGIPYICTNFNYTPNALGDNYKSIGFNVPSGNGWISNMGYGNRNLDWVFIPSAANATANSAVPVGDSVWGTANLDGFHVGVIGGVWNGAESNGPFAYGFDRGHTEVRNTYSARLMFIPTKNNIYEANILKWQNKMGE